MHTQTNHTQSSRASQKLCFWHRSERGRTLVEGPRLLLHRHPRHHHVPQERERKEYYYYDAFLPPHQSYEGTHAKWLFLFSSPHASTGGGGEMAHHFQGGKDQKEKAVRERASEQKQDMWMVHANPKMSIFRKGHYRVRVAQHCSRRKEDKVSPPSYEYCTRTADRSPSVVPIILWRPSKHVCTCACEEEGERSREPIRICTV